MKICVLKCYVLGVGIDSQQIDPLVCLIGKNCKVHDLRKLFNGEQQGTIIKCLRENGQLSSERKWPAFFLKVVLSLERFKIFC